MSRIEQRRRHARDEPSSDYTLRRTAILEAAARVFQRVGYDRASMSDVAAEAGSDRASVYYYFKGKREIFHAVIIDAVQFVVLEAERIAAGPTPPADQMRELIRTVMGAYRDHYPYLYVYVQEDMAKLDEDDPDSAELKLLARRFTVTVDIMITEGIRTGAVKADLEPTLVANAVIGALNWTHRWFRPGRTHTADDVADAFTEIFLRGILN